MGCAAIVVRDLAASRFAIGGFAQEEGVAARKSLVEVAGFQQLVPGYFWAVAKCPNVVVQQ